MATRSLKHNEVYALARNEKFVATVESAVMHKCIYMYDLHKAAVQTENGFSGLSNQEKAEYNFSATCLRNGALVNNTGFAKMFAIYLLNDAIGINIPEENNEEVFSPQEITEVMVNDGIINRDHAALNKVYQIFLENVGIDTPVLSWING